eukprot:TRINITY_DN5080_c1_g1_i1.p1 TRINITY_DN5080_c1_g1~~TRINITY_DN5080_c1_g1_i1.p1  ORF type:complete len:225 (-),score=48.13 TRINITY_DN5080_c1_g1_i1:123-698(-)
MNSQSKEANSSTITNFPFVLLNNTSSFFNYHRGTFIGHVMELYLLHYYRQGIELFCFCEKLLKNRDLCMNCTGGELLNQNILNLTMVGLREASSIFDYVYLHRSLLSPKFFWHLVLEHGFLLDFILSHTPTPTSTDTKDNDLKLYERDIHKMLTLWSSFVESSPPEGSAYEENILTRARKWKNYEWKTIVV